MMLCCAPSATTDAEIITDDQEEELKVALETFPEDVRKLVADASDVKNAVEVITGKAETGAQKKAAAKLLGMSEAKSLDQQQKETETATQDVLALAILDGNWRTEKDAATFIRATIQGTFFNDPTIKFNGMLSDGTNNSFKITSNSTINYGNGKATYTSDKITWANGEVYVRTQVEQSGAWRKKYSDAESILNAMESDSVQMLRCSWLRDQPSDFIFPKRGDGPAESIIEAKEVRALWDGRKPKSTYKYPDQRIECLPFIALSYFWRSKAHPDPKGVTSAMVVKALKHMWKEYGEANYTEMSMFIDWCSLYQAERTPEQQEMFLTSLKDINLWYAHQQASLYCITNGDVDDLTYWDKGWTTFEFKVANLIKPSNPTVHRVFPLFIDISADDFGLGTRDGEGRAYGGSLKRAAPSEILAFFAGHEYSTKIYTNGADRDKIVAPAFKRTMIEVMGSAETLIFNGCEWDDDGFEQLCAALCLCKELKLLELLGMTGTDKSAQSLIKLLNKPDVLPKLNFIQMNSGPAWKSMTKESRAELQAIQKTRKMETLWLP